MLVKQRGMSFKVAWGTTFPEILLLADADRLAQTGGVRLDRDWLERLKKQQGVN